MFRKVDSNSNHCLFGELSSASVRVRHTGVRQLTHWSLKYHGVKRPNLHGVSCRPRLVCGMTFHTPLFDTGTLDGFKRAVNSWLLPLVVFFSCLWYS